MKDLLSKKEKQVVLLSSQDKSACEIAAILNKSTYTVQKQLDDAKKKLGCNTVQGLTAKCITLNLLAILALLFSLFFTMKDQGTVLTQLPQQISTIEEIKTLLYVIPGNILRSIQNT